jgi:hypothetical protein
MFAVGSTPTRSATSVHREKLERARLGCFIGETEGLVECGEILDLHKVVGLRQINATLSP